MLRMLQRRRAARGGGAPEPPAGLTLLELVVASAILMVLATMADPGKSEQGESKQHGPQGRAAATLVLPSFDGSLCLVNLDLAEQGSPVAVNQRLTNSWTSRSCWVDREREEDRL